MRKRQTPKPVFEIASGDPHLGQLMARARRLKSLEACLRRVLAPELAARVRVADLKDGTLVLGASSPAAASRLRFAEADIVKALGENCSPPVHKIKVRVVAELT